MLQTSFGTSDTVDFCMPDAFPVTQPTQKQKNTDTNYGKEIIGFILCWSDTRRNRRCCPLCASPLLCQYASKCFFHV